MSHDSLTRLRRQGQSLNTEEKERGFGSFFGCNCAVCVNIDAKSDRRLKYFHFDLHAGSGHNEDVIDPESGEAILGSPLVFQQVAERYPDLDWVMHAAEREPDRSAQLAAALAYDDRCIVHCVDNAELVIRIPQLIRRAGVDPEWAYGSVLLDPNNCNAGAIPWERLEQLFKICKRLDVAFNFPATAMKRVGPESDHFREIERLPRQFNKRHWLIRRPIGSWQFTLVIGRNYRMGKHTRLNLVEWDSPEGREYREIASLTREERKERLARMPKPARFEQGELF